MENSILGVCPTCYKVVKSKDSNVSITDSSGAIFYHQNCEPNRLKFMKRNEFNWKKEGSEARELREKWSCSISELAEHLQVSEKKIRKYESGQPVTHAKLLGMAYSMYFKLLEYHESDILNAKHNM